MKLLIDVDDQTLTKVEKEAEKEKRSRKATLEKIIEDHYA